MELLCIVFTASDICAAFLQFSAQVETHKEQCHAPDCQGSWLPLRQALGPLLWLFTYILALQMAYEKTADCL